MSASAFLVEHAALDADRPEWGGVADLPWDHEVFGFASGDWRVDHAALRQADVTALEAAIERWARGAGAEIVATTLAASASVAIAIVQQLGFRYVETSLRVVLPRPHDAGRGSIGVRRATAADRSGLVAIAGSAFRVGRYHADARFPRDLADARYRRWVERALDGADPSDRVYAIGPEGAPRGFLHARLDGDVADLRLAAVDASTAGLDGYALFAGGLAALRGDGAARATARISAQNVGVMNLYAGLGFRFSDPEVVLHWHGPRLRAAEPA